MKVSNIKDIDKFFAVVDSCEGRVELVTGEGDRLNLKSKLSQYVSLANIFSGGEIPEIEIVAYEKDDIDKLIAFAKKYQNTSAINSQEVLEQLNKLSGNLKNQLSGLFNKAQSEGWFDKIINFIKSLFN